VSSQTNRGLSLLRDVLSFKVEDSKDADFHCSNSVEDGVRKPAQNSVPDFAMNDFVLFGISLYPC